MTIRLAVGRLKGIGKISGEAKSKTLNVEYEPSVLTVESVQEALMQIGYESVPLT